jgi:hypothetical protein
MAARLYGSSLRLRKTGVDTGLNGVTPPDALGVVLDLWILREAAVALRWCRRFCRTEADFVALCAAKYAARHPHPSTAPQPAAAGESYPVAATSPEASC